jgi:hypothetical protein
MERSYSPETMEEVRWRVEKTTQTYPVIAAATGVSATSVSRWKCRYGVEAAAGGVRAPAGAERQVRGRQESDGGRGALPGGRGPARAQPRHGAPRAPPPVLMPCSRPHGGRHLSLFRKPHASHLPGPWWSISPRLCGAACDPGLGTTAINKRCQSSPPYTARVRQLLPSGLENGRDAVHSTIRG